jgi:signal transduction protein with GAF and PtsI domain
MADQRNLRFLLNVTRNLFSDMHLSSMIQQITMQVHHLLKADDCALYLVDSESKEFYLAKQEGDGPHRKYPFTVGIVGSVAQSGKVVRISRDAFRDPRFSAAVDQRKDHVTHRCAVMQHDGTAHAFADRRVRPAQHFVLSHYERC